MPPEPEDMIILPNYAEKVSNYGISEDPDESTYTMEDIFIKLFSIEKIKMGIIVFLFDAPPVTP